MIIPCIDVMQCKVVQLVQGKEKALERSLEETMDWMEGFPLIHVIDLDAAMGRGQNLDLVERVLQRFRARVGGGIRTLEDAKRMADLGAEMVIVGSAAYDSNGPRTDFLDSISNEIGQEKLMVAVDVLGGRIAVKGWMATMNLSPIDAIESLEQHCGGFLCTNVDKEGLMGGTDVEYFKSLRSATNKTFTAAGGISTMDEIRELTSNGIETALGMAIYTEAIDLNELRRLVQPSL